MFHDSSFARQFDEALPPSQSPEVSDRYAFIDTRRVISDMRDLGFEIFGCRFPKYRTRAGRYGLHEVDFRRPADMKVPTGEVPRILFTNSYDGSRRAQILSGIFRFVCSNGMIIGTTLQNEKFLHLGGYEDELVAQIKDAGQTASKVFDRVDRFKSIEVPRETLLKMARRAIDLRTKDTGKHSLEPRYVIMPRRREDMQQDLWTQWNVIQENLLKGGLPAKSADGSIRITRPMNQIQKSNDLNQGLWDLLEETAEALG